MYIAIFDVNPLIFRYSYYHILVNFFFREHILAFSEEICLIAIFSRLAHYVSKNDHTICAVRTVWAADDIRFCLQTNVCKLGSASR